MFKAMKIQRAEALVNLQKSLSNLPDDRGSGFGLTVGLILVILTHTLSTLYGLTAMLVTYPFVMLKWLFLIPAVAIYGWGDGLILIFWFYRQALKKGK